MLDKLNILFEKFKAKDELPDALKKAKHENRVRISTQIRGLDLKEIYKS